MTLDWIEEYVNDHEIRVYGGKGKMSPRAKSVLRAMKMREHDHYIAMESRVDNHTGHDDQ